MNQIDLKNNLLRVQSLLSVHRATSGEVQQALSEVQRDSNDSFQMTMQGRSNLTPALVDSLEQNNSASGEQLASTVSTLQAKNQELVVDKANVGAKAHELERNLYRDGDEIAYMAPAFPPGPAQVALAAALQAAVEVRTTEPEVPRKLEVTDLDRTARLTESVLTDAKEISADTVGESIADSKDVKPSANHANNCLAELGTEYMQLGSAAVSAFQMQNGLGLSLQDASIKVDAALRQL